MPRAGLTSEVVVDTAAEMIDELGAEHLTLAALAERFGVAVPSLYKHIEGLPDLRSQLTVRAVRELGAALDRAAAATADTPGVALHALGAAYRRYAREHPGRYTISLRAPDPADTAHLEATEQVLDTVLAMLGRYELSGDAAIDAARTVRAALHGFVSLEAAGGFGLPREVDRSFEQLLDALDRALADWP